MCTLCMATAGSATVSESSLCSIGLQSLQLKQQVMRHISPRTQVQKVMCQQHAAGMWCKHSAGGLPGQAGPCLGRALVGRLEQQAAEAKGAAQPAAAGVQEQRRLRGAPLALQADLHAALHSSRCSERRLAEVVNCTW